MHACVHHNVSVYMCLVHAHASIYSCTWKIKVYYSFMVYICIIILTCLCIYVCSSVEQADSSLEKLRRQVDEVIQKYIVY